MINIIAYRPSWAAEFQHIAGVLRTGLGDAAMQIDHIWSTSVPHLCAKDVIDIQITVAMIDSEAIDALRHIGFVQHPDIANDREPNNSNAYASRNSASTK
jgi:GrpB-like predicted nucleotidyltransferase (UPF0157 family)